MASVRLEFSQFGDFDSFSIYRSTSPIDLGNLPAPLAGGLSKMYYEDTVNIGFLYYYCIAAHLGSDVTYSDQKFIYTGFGDPFFNSTIILTPAAFDTGNSLQTNLKNFAASPVSSQIYNYQYGFLAKGLLDNSRFIRIMQGNVRATLPAALGTADFTIEIQCIPDESSLRNIYGRIFQIGENGASGTFLMSQNNTINPPVIFVQGYNPGGIYMYTDVSSKGALSLTKYSHVCIMRTSGVFRFYINGKLISTDPDNVNFNISKRNLYIGSNTSGSEQFSMLLGGFRISTGNVYNINGFEPITTLLENNQNVMLLYKDGSNGFKDYSSNNVTFDSTGLIISHKPKFDAGLLYLSETGRYQATIPVLGTTDFTLESFVILNKTNSQWGRIFQIGPNGTFGALFVYLIQNYSVAGFQLVNSGGSYFDVQGTDLTLSTTVWKHLCIMRKDGVFYAYVDGVRFRMDSSQKAYNISHNTLYIGTNNSGSEYADISLNGLRLTRIARYPVEGFDPPSAAYPMEL